MSQPGIESLLQEVTENALANGMENVLDALRVTIDSMKSDSQTPTASIMNAVLEEVYAKTVERLRQGEK